MIGYNSVSLKVGRDYGGFFFFGTFCCLMAAVWGSIGDSLRLLNARHVF